MPCAPRGNGRLAVGTAGSPVCTGRDPHGPDYQRPVRFQCGKSPPSRAATSFETLPMETRISSLEARASRPPWKRRGSKVEALRLGWESLLGPRTSRPPWKRFARRLKRCAWGWQERARRPRSQGRTPNRRRQCGCVIPDAMRHVSDASQIRDRVRKEPHPARGPVSAPHPCGVPCARDDGDGSADIRLRRRALNGPDCAREDRGDDGWSGVSRGAVYRWS
ncbi:hypothetical protein J3R73_000485 [Labrys monachus]|uniref:Uncharacterized protein n=1 Tax=Labrys monachus TaxID=217067 RepID=A0ABU0F9C8_9HYPH|nr:hypothetical protein [Labrys monachus]